MNYLTGTQTKIQTGTKHKEQKSVATQCNLLDAPPLELLKPTDDLLLKLSQKKLIMIHYFV